MNMLRYPAFHLLAALMFSAAATAAWAQYGDNQDSGDTAGDSNTARLQVELTQLEEQIRKLQGRIEEVSFENKQLKAELDKSNGDMQFRLGVLEKKQATAVASAAPAPNDSSQLKPVEPATQAQDSNDIPTSADATAAAAPAAAPLPKFANPREHYNYAFKLLNQAKYTEAGDAFAAFTQKYPKDALIGNAYYWLGETYYVRHDYVKSADDFRLGYESLPTGPKAADNLLKLAMSLDALNKDKESCIVLKQVVAKFGSVSSSAKSRAEQEMNRIGCN